MILQAPLFFSIIKPAPVLHRHPLGSSQRSPQNDHGRQLEGKGPSGDQPGVVQHRRHGDAANGGEAGQKPSRVAPAASSCGVSSEEDAAASVRGAEEEHGHRHEDVGEGGEQGPPVVPEGARLFFLRVFFCDFRSRVRFLFRLLISIKRKRALSLSLILIYLFFSLTRICRSTPSEKEKARPARTGGEDGVLFVCFFGKGVEVES